MSEQLDCVVIGYNETPFAEYEALLRGYGADSEAYRDLRFSFVNINDRKLDYIGLLNHVLKLATANGGEVNGEDELKSCDIPNLAAVYLTHCGSQVDSLISRKAWSMWSIASMLSIVACDQTKPSPSILYFSR